MILSIVIVNWNTRDLIKTCVESVFDTTPVSELDYEVIVIDNGSSDGSKEYLLSLGNKIRFISNENNTGYAKACNQGMKISSGKYILLLGSDTRMRAGTLKTCVEYLEQNVSAGAAGCKLLYPDGKIQNSTKKFPSLRNAFFAYLSLDKLNRDYDMAGFSYDKTIAVDQIATTFLMIRSEVLKKVGYFDESYRILYNDVDLCKRIINAGWNIIFLHTCSIFHLGSHSTKNADFAIRKTMYSDIYRYYIRNFGFKAKFLYPILVIRLLIVSTIKA
jgi:GT2 family glycosyltransferase